MLWTGDDDVSIIRQYVSSNCYLITIISIMLAGLRPHNLFQSQYNSPEVSSVSDLCSSFLIVGIL
jgi:hypothetical protein